MITNLQRLQLRWIPSLYILLRSQWWIQGGGGGGVRNRRPHKIRSTMGFLSNFLSECLKIRLRLHKRALKQPLFRASRAIKKFLNTWMGADRRFELWSGSDIDRRPECSTTITQATQAGKVTCWNPMESLVGITQEYINGYWQTW